MKRKKDEKIESPMFPRLHVNDAEKRGPRGPPRNKMALYEQFSIPSQRFNHSNNTAANINTAANLESPSNQGVANEHDMLLSYQQRPPRHHQSEKPYDPCNFSRQLNSHNFEKTRQEVKSQNSKEFATKATSLSTNDKVEYAKKQADSSMRCEARDRLDVEQESIVVLDEINSPAPIPIRASNSEGFGDLRNESGNQDMSSFRSSVHTRVDSVSQTSAVDSISRLDITPDEVVEIIGAKRFWKARRAILNQQRVFAVQVFELHRLVKVQRLIAEAPRTLGKPTKALPRARIPKQKDKVIENSGGDTSRKPPLCSVQNAAPPPIRWPLPSISNNHNARPLCLSQGQGQGQQWLIPVMTPSEGLVYKPYPGPAFRPPAPPGPAFGPPAPGPMPSNFLPPAPHYPPAGPRACLPTYGHPMMNRTTFSGPSVEQNPSHMNRDSPKDVEGRDDDTEEIDVLPLFPIRPETRSSPRRSKPEGPVQVIKVVPHNARSATESAARIFQTIQQERRQYESM